MTAATAAPRLVHALPGRVRFHLPVLRGREPEALVSRLRCERGVREVEANPLTGNVLVHFDPAETDAERLLDLLDSPAELPAAQTRTQEDRPPQSSAPSPPPRVGQRIRIPLRGLEGNPEFAARVVEQVERHAGVHASASTLTGRLLVQTADAGLSLDELVAEARRLEPPATSAPPPAVQQPLDPAALNRSLLRLGGAALGLAVVAARALTGARMGGAAALRIAGTLTILQGAPPLQRRLRRALGPDVAEMALSLPKIAVLTLAGSPLGLVVAGAEALHLYLALREQRRGLPEPDAGVAQPLPGRTLRLQAGQQTPLAATVLEGWGTATGADALPVPAAPGTLLPAGARIQGGPLRVRLEAGEPTAEIEPVPASPSLTEQYLQVISPLTLAYAGATALVTRSFDRAFVALLLLSPRAAMIGTDAAAAGGAARMVRAGATLGARRTERQLRRPDHLLLEGPRVLCDGLELIGSVPLSEGVEAAEILSRAASVSAAAGSPWGAVFPAAELRAAAHADFDGVQANAELDGVRFSLAPAADEASFPASLRLQHRGHFMLLLSRESEEQPLGALILRPRLAAGAGGMVEECRRQGIGLSLLAGDNVPAARTLAERLGIAVEEGGALEAIQERQRRGERVMLLADGGAGNHFAAVDLAVVVGSPPNVPIAGADLQVPDLATAGAVLEAAGCQETVQRDAVGLSFAANVAGAVWGVRGQSGLAQASRLADGAALAALALAWTRLRGGEAAGAALRIQDPRPERWGEMSAAEVLRALDATAAGLSGAQAVERRRAALALPARNALAAALLGNLRSPLTVFVSAATGLMLLHGSRADALVMGLTLAANLAVGTWQEYRVGEVAEELKRLGTASARVLRDGEPATVPASELVPGDVLLLAPGDRVAADARVLRATGLEVDEAALTGESLPVRKLSRGGIVSQRIVLEGSDVLVGHGTAVVVAVGHQTRMGATVAALATQEERESPLAERLSRLFRQVLPVTLGAGAIVTAGGLVRGRPLLPELIAGASIALAALPEALPILAGMGQVAAARRLARRQVLVRRPAAVEALGRVDVACVDKTGTLTEGRLAVQVVADCDGTAVTLPERLAPPLRRVLLTAALASPHPEAGDAASHSTDVAVIRAAAQAGLRGELRAVRDSEVRFDSTRSYHAARVLERLYVKGAPEALVHRCSAVAGPDGPQPLADGERVALLSRAHYLAEQGLRVIMVAEGGAETSADDPRELVALGFLGISDPLRATVHAALERCHEAGIRVIMLTGDHPASARAIAREAGLLNGREEVLTGADLARLADPELDERMERTAVIARATPLDKLRIIESLHRRGHTIAMTGDGVNDAPALRLADVGFAMGGGTEVARQAADVVIADDDFASLVEALVEGRSFWRNLRRALGLLLGGNLGELGFMMVGSVFGLGATLTVRQILATNLITDALPAFAVAVQQPEDRRLAGLDREGAASLDQPLREEILRRSLATAAPALAAYLLAVRTGSVLQARSVGFATIVTTQLALTLEAGRAQGNLTRPVIGAVVASGGALLALLTIPPLRSFFELAAPHPLGWTLIGGGAAAAAVLSRVLPGAGANGRPSPFPSRLLPAPTQS